MQPKMPALKFGAVYRRLLKKLVPRGGLKWLFTVKHIGCPTLQKRSIEFQGVFSALSHRFNARHGNRTAAAKPETN
jgi:hypothetical protein